MSKPVLLAVGGAVAGIVVALAVFVLVLKPGPVVAEAVAVEPTPVVVPGKLGPHLTLGDRVFNLVGGTVSVPVYLKLQTVIEFETTDEAWARVLNGCPKAGRVIEADVLVSAAPGGGRAERVMPASPGGGETGAGAACQREQEALLAAFQADLGTGIQLIEDAVTTIVTGHTVAEVSTPTGKEALKEEIRRAVDAIFHGHPKVTRVLFLNFITQ